MIRKWIPCVLFSLSGWAMFLFAPEASADEDTEIQQAIDAYEESPWELGLAAGYGMRSNPLVNSDDIPLYVLLDIAWFGDWFFFDNGDLGLTLHETDKLSVNLLTHVNNERGVFEWLNNSQIGVQFAPEVGANMAPTHNPCLGNNPDHPVIEPIVAPGPEIELTPETGLERPTEFAPTPNLNKEPIKPPKRSFAVDAGLEIIYADGWGDIQLQILSDISLTHKGMEVWASYAYSWDYGHWKLTPSVGLNWKSGRLLDYYYGVGNCEARDNRPAYQANAGFNSFARLSLSYHINDHWGIVGVAEYETLSRSIRRSPIVNQNSIKTLFVGIMYRF